MEGFGRQLCTPSWRTKVPHASGHADTGRVGGRGIADMVAPREGRRNTLSLEGYVECPAYRGARGGLLLAALAFPEVELKAHCPPALPLAAVDGHLQRIR